MSDLLKRLAIGGTIGFAVAILVGWGSYEVPFIKSLLDDYEFLSYDGRMRAKTTGVEENSIDDVVIIDIDNQSVAPPEEGGLGRYFNWPQAYHGQLTDVVTSSLQLYWSPPIPLLHVVEPGESLWEIAKEKLGKGAHWEEIYDLNKDVLESSRLIRPAQELEIPGEAAPDYYQVFRQAQNDPEAQFEYMGEAYDVMYTLSGRTEWDGYNFAVVPIYPDGSSGEGHSIDSVSLIEPKALLFDIIFDPENTFNYDLVNALTNETAPKNEALSDVTGQFLASNDPALFLEATNNSQKAYHALVFEQEDTLNWLYKMDMEPEGYYFENHIIHGISEEAKSKLPKADRVGNTYVDLLSAAVGAGSANFPQDEDGIIRRSPTAIYFEGPDHVYPSLVMSAAIDILGIKKDGGFDYDFENNILRLVDTTDTVVREIPIDDHGRMYVNYYGRFKTFYYLPYMYCFDPEMLPPEYWEGKVAFVGASLPGLMDLRNTPVQETFAGVEIHANVMQSLLKGEFVQPKHRSETFWVIIFTCIVLGIVVSLPEKPLFTLPVPIVGVVAWILFTYSQFFSSLVMWEVVRPALAMISTYGGIFLYNFLVVEKDKRFLKDTFGAYISPELIDQMFDAKEEPSLGGNEGYHTAFFTDIQSFSAFSEKLSASDLVELLNDYLTDIRIYFWKIKER